MRLPHRRARSFITKADTSGTVRHRLWNEDGDTLIELLIAIVILGIIAAPILLAFMTSIMGSAAYRNVATMDTVLKSAANEVTSQVGIQPEHSHARRHLRQHLRPSPCLVAIS